MTKLLCSPRLTLVAFILAGTVFSASGADLVLQKVPAFTVEQSSAYPENLARYHSGALVEALPKSHPIADLQLAADQNTAESALLCDDSTIGYALPAGRSSLIVALATIQNIGRISFLNHGAQGDFSIATASAKLPADSSKWRTVLERKLSSAVLTELESGEAKYIRFTFDVTQPGRIAGLGIYSTSQITDFTAPRSTKISAADKSDSFALISNSLTDVHGRARALYVSSGTERREATNMIDDQTATAYNFASNDDSPSAIIDLGRPAALRRLSVTYSPHAGKMDFYVLKALPAEVKSNGSVSNSICFDESAFAEMKAVGSVTDEIGSGRAAIDFPATAGRYVMIRWTPARDQDGSFSVAEVAAFGSTDQPNTLFAYTTGSRTTTESGDGKTTIDGKTMIDAKDAPAEGPATEPLSPADGPPPTLPQPPPFTFVPVLAPTSP